MKRILGVLLAGVLLLSGCGQWQKSQKESAYHLYCLDKTGTTLVQEPYEPKEGTDQKLIKELVDALQEKPAKDGNQALLSNGISIKTYTLENGLLTLNLSGEYGELARPQEVLVRAGLVRTFVQVPEVERVTLLIDGDPQGSLTISLGNPQPDGGQLSGKFRKGNLSVSVCDADTVFCK